MQYAPSMEYTRNICDMLFQDPHLEALFANKRLLKRSGKESIRNAGEMMKSHSSHWVCKRADNIESPKTKYDDPEHSALSSPLGK